MKWLFQVLTTFVLLALTHCQIFAIDFGTQFIKAAVVNKGSGKAFSIVQTPRSQRKFINSIGFYSEQRFYESESIPKRTRYPNNCFIFNKLLIQSVINPQLATTIKKDLLLSYITDQMNDPLLAQFTLQNFPVQTSKVTLIQVVAMIIKYARSNAEKQIKQQIKDVVITVPSYWNVRMRAFIIQAAQIADLHVLSLISENSAAAINYALNQRTKNTTQTIVLYNLGSNALQVSLVQFKGVPQQKSNKPVQSIFILGDWSKNYVGGLRIDSILFNYFKKRFQAKYKKQLNVRGSIKLWGQISEVKQVLSANKDSPIYVQGIMDGIDYHDKVTRTQFQQMIDPILKQITSPLKRFLFDHNLRPEDIDSVELIGGSIRIPKLQSMIAQIIGNSSKVGTHINADQAMVLGAAFYGANSSKKFKVKGVNLYDGFNFQIRAVLKNMQDGIGEDDPRYFYRNVTVFNKKSRFGLSKELNFKCHENIIIELYKQDESGTQLLRSDKLDNIKSVNVTDFKVSITLVVDPIQVVQIKKAQIKYKQDELTTYMQKVKKQKTGSQKKQEQNDKQEEDKQKQVEQQITKQAQQQEEKQQKQSQQKQQSNNNQQQKNDQQSKQKDQQKQQKQQVKTKQNNQNKKKQKKKKQKQAKDEYETVQRTKTVTKKYEKDLHIQQTYSREKADKQSLQKSRKMLKQYEKAEHQRKQLSQSKNKLEALIYQIKQKVQNDDFLQFTQKSQKSHMQDLVKQKQQWLDETSSNNRHDYDQQSKALAKPLDKIKKRIHQYQSRQVHYRKALHSVQQYRNLTLNITKKKQWIAPQQIDALLQKIDDWKSQIEDIYQKMEDTAQNETCILQIKDIQKIIDKVKDEYFKVMATPKPTKKQKKQQSKQKQQKSADQSEQL